LARKKSSKYKSTVSGNISWVSGSGSGVSTPIGGTLKAGTLQETMGIYPGSSNPSPRGIVQVIIDTFGNIKVYMNTMGMALSCNSTNTALNGCGIHIHAGTVCNDNTLISGHYWTPATAADPWINIRYPSDTQGTTNANINMNGGNGYDYNGNKGHALVIHDAGGTRIACGILY
jgi:Cu/Zn superoxide dismutase